MPLCRSTFFQQRWYSINIDMPIRGLDLLFTATMSPTIPARSWARSRLLARPFWMPSGTRNAAASGRTLPPATAAGASDCASGANDVLYRQQQVLFEVSDEANALRAGKLAGEFKLDLMLLGSGDEFRRLDDIRSQLRVCRSLCRWIFPSGRMFQRSRWLTMCLFGGSDDLGAGSNQSGGCSRPCAMIAL